METNRPNIREVINILREKLDKIDSVETWSNEMVFYDQVNFQDCLEMSLR